MAGKTKEMSQIKQLLLLKKEGVSNRKAAAIVGINKVNGTETIVLGSQQYTQKDGKGKAQVFANAIKHDFKSKNPTTRWSDIIKLK